MSSDSDEGLSKFKEEFPILLHMFQNNQGGFELITYRDYGKKNDEKLILLYTDRYISNATKAYLYDERNIQAWEIKHVNAHAYSRHRIKLEIVLKKVDKNDN